MLIVLFILSLTSIFSTQDLSLILKELDKATEEIPDFQKKEIKIKKKITLKKSSRYPIRSNKYPINKSYPKFIKKNITLLYKKKQEDKELKIIDKYSKKIGLLLGFGLLFSPEKYLSQSFIKDINNSGGDLENTTYYKSLGFSAYYNLSVFLNPYFNFLFLFSNQKSTNIALSYGLEKIKTSIAYHLYGFNFLFGSKYDVLKIEHFVFTLIPSLGFSILRGYILMKPEEPGASHISNSYLGFGGVSFAASVEGQIKFMISQTFALGFNISYLYSVLKNVKISDSLGEFSYQYPKNNILAIYNNSTKETEDFNLNFSGIKTGIFLEIKF